jgi:hypothetical protein
MDVPVTAMPGARPVLQAALQRFGTGNRPRMTARLPRAPTMEPLSADAPMAAPGGTPRILCR